MLMKLTLKILTLVHVPLYRLTRGRIGASMGSNIHMLLLTTTGRKSGRPRTVPLSYFEDGSRYLIIGSYGGLDQPPAWYLNLQSNPQAIIQIGATQLRATAKTAQGEERQRLWSKVVEVAPWYAGYQKRAAREIPVVILEPEH